MFVWMESLYPEYEVLSETKSRLLRRSRLLYLNANLCFMGSVVQKMEWAVD